MAKNHTDAQMVEWLKSNFEVSSNQEKVAVDVVRGVFNQKFFDESNNTFGKVVRQAFPGVTRSRDGGGYIYKPLKVRETVLTPRHEHQPSDKPYGSLQSKCFVDNYVQTSEESPKKVFETKIKELTTKASLLERDSESLKSELFQLKEKNRKLKDALAKRRKTELDQGRLSSKCKMVAVNMINPADLEKEKDTTKNIGEGSYGECSLQLFKRTGNLVVVKSMKHKQPDAVIHEARAMQSVTSQRFPFVYGVQLINPPFSIVMEFIGDQERKISTTLYDVLTREEEVFQEMKKEMEKKTWVVICQDIGEGLSHLHSLGILHNDLKNNNVLVYKGRGFIIDLGKACEASSPPKGKKYSHSYNHIAPEVLQGSCFSFDSDIFSLGQILNFVRKSCSISELRNLEKDCTNKNHVMRPTARIVADKLRDVHHSLD